MKDHKITEIKIDGKTKGYYGRRIPQTAQEIIDEVEKEMEIKYNGMKGGNKKDGFDKLH